MIHYTPLPLEAVFDGWEELTTAPQEISIDGITMLVEPLNEREAKIVRLISPDPAHFLNPAYEPGKTISFVPRTNA